MVDQSNNVYEVFTYTGSKSLVGAKRFSSGNKTIDSFVTKGTLKQQASKSPGSGVKVLLDKNNEMKLAGFLTLSVCSLQRQIFADKVENVGKTKEIPVTKLIMLGVDENYQKKGLGLQLLRVAFDSTKQVAKEINCSGLFLEADPDAVDFYKKYNFIQLDEADPNTGIVPMFIHLDSIP